MMTKCFVGKLLIPHTLSRYPTTDGITDEVPTPTPTMRILPHCYPNIYS